MRYRRNSGWGRRRRMRPDTRLIILLSVIVVILAIAVVGLWLRNQKRQETPADSETFSAEESVGTEETGSAEKEAAETETAGEQTVPESSSAGTPGSEAVSQTAPAAGITYPLPAKEAVGDDYFQDALFIGDSRTIGFQMHSGITGATFYTDTGAAAKTAMTKAFIPQTVLRNKPQGASAEVKLTLEQALQNDGTFGKVYLGFGINETGYEDWEVLQYYNALIDLLQQYMPSAKIYVQSVVNVTEARSAKGDYVTNDRINHYNEIFRQMAEEQGVYFVNINEALVNSKGVLPDEASSDGVHFLKSYYQKWYEYLKSHTA